MNSDGYNLIADVPDDYVPKPTSCVERLLLYDFFRCFHTHEELKELFNIGGSNNGK